MGFTEEEILSMMKYYNVEQYYNRLKEWYEGYKFSGVDIFCPWDSMLYCKQLYFDHNKEPQLYWTDTSHNQIVYDLLERYGHLAKKDVETLLSGDTITKYVNQFLNYRDIDRAKKDSEKALNSIWSMLLMTGYLTAVHSIDNKTYELKIPNYEILDIYLTSFIDYMKENYAEDTEIMIKIDEAIAKQEAENVAKYIHEYLPSVYPIGAELHSGEKESDYQNLLASVFRVKEWVFRREVEAGTGRCDFIIRMPNSNIGIIIEFKHAQNGKEEAFNNACNEALAQIEEKKYANYFAIEYPYYHVIYCGMAFYHQDCKVVFYDPQTKERKESGISGALVSDSLKSKTTETASTKSSKETKETASIKSSKETKAKEESEAKEAKTNKKPIRETKAKEESEAKEPITNKKSSRKSKAKEEPEAKEAKQNEKSTRKSQAKRKPKTDKTSPSTDEKDSLTAEILKEKQKIIKKLAENGMTAKKKLLKL
jgi:chemotaxis protein histidine kinase CheA